MAKFAAVFRFKSIGAVGVAAAEGVKAVPDALDALLSEQFSDADEALTAVIRGSFEQVKARDGSMQWKRKEVSVELDAPEWIAQLPAVAQKILTDAIAAFVKSEYIDNFQPAGAHDWTLVEGWYNSSGSRASAVDKETLKKIGALFGDYVAQLAKNARLKEPMSKVVELRCSASAIKRYVGEVSEEAFSRLENLLAMFAEWAIANAADDGDDVATVLALCTRNIDKARKGDSTNVLDLLASLPVA